MMSKQLEPTETSANFLVSDEYKPELVVERGVQIAQVLTDLIARSGMFHQIRGVKGAYVSTEGWQATCSMMRVFPQEIVNNQVLPPKYEENGAKLIHGAAYEAIVELRRPDGTIISRASARCGGPDDRPWDKRPAQACKSMAGTRAFNKAARLVFGWIVKAKPGRKEDGTEVEFEATPSEEMEAATKNDDRHVRQNTNLPDPPPAEDEHEPTIKQANLLRQLLKNTTPEAIKVYMTSCGIDPEKKKLNRDETGRMLSLVLDIKHQENA